MLKLEEKYASIWKIIEFNNRFGNVLEMEMSYLNWSLIHNKLMEDQQQKWEVKRE